MKKQCTNEFPMVLFYLCRIFNCNVWLPKGKIKICVLSESLLWLWCSRMSEVTVHIVAKVHYKFLLTLKDRSDQTYRNTSKLPSNKIMYVCNMFGDWNWRYQSFDMKCQLRLKDPCCRILGWLLFLTPPKKKMKEFLINPWQPVIYSSQLTHSKFM